MPNHEGPTKCGRVTDLDKTLVANLPTLGPALIWLPKRISHFFNRLWAYIEEERKDERIGPFPHRPPKSPTPGSISSSSTPRVVSRSLTPQLIARRSTPELSATPRYRPVYYEMTGLPNNEERELEQLVSAHTDAV